MVSNELHAVISDGKATVVSGVLELGKNIWISASGEFTVDDVVTTTALHGFNFDPHQPRDAEGQWTKNPVSSVKDFLKKLKNARVGDKAYGIVASTDEFGAKGPGGYGEHHSDTVQGFPSVVGDYQVDGFRINGDLRTGGDKKWHTTSEGWVQGWRPVTDAFDEAMGKKRSKLKSDIIVERGIQDPTAVWNGGWSSSDNVGLTWIDKGYASTTTDASVATHFSSKAHEGVITGQPVIMRIVVPKGTPALRFGENGTHAQYNWEREVLLPRSSRYRVMVDHGVDENGIHRLDVELISHSEGLTAAVVSTNTEAKSQQTKQKDLPKTPPFIDVGPLVEIIDEPEHIVAAVNAEFNAMHPRGKDGKFITKGHVGAEVFDVISDAISDIGNITYQDLLTTEKDNFIAQVNNFDLGTWHNFTDDQKSVLTKAVEDALDDGIPGSATAMAHLEELDNTDVNVEDVAPNELLFEPDVPLPPAPKSTLKSEPSDVTSPPSMTTGKATPIKMTHALIHAKHGKGEVIAQTNDGKVRVTWNGDAYEVGFKHGGPTETLKKSQLYAYLAKNFPNEQWNAPGKQNVEVSAPSVTEALPSAPSVPHPVAPKHQADVIDMAGWKQIGGQTGSNKGGLFEAPNGDRYYVKSMKSAKHAKNEVLAANLYKMAGIDVPEVRHGENHPLGWGNAIASKIVPNAKTDPGKLKNDVVFKAKVQQGFATDAWLANWDTMGLTLDNVVDSDGKPWRIDFGGSLEYRAQGTPKGEAFGYVPVELQTLRDAKLNPSSAAVFGGMSNGQIRESAKMLLPITDEKIRQAVKDQGLPDSLADKLIARRSYILDEYNLQTNNIDTSALPEIAEPPNLEALQIKKDAAAALNAGKITEAEFDKIHNWIEQGLLKDAQFDLDAFSKGKFVAEADLSPLESLDDIAAKFAVPHSSEQVITNWPGVTGKKYEEGDVVALATDGMSRITKGPGESFVIETKPIGALSPDEPWKVDDVVDFPDQVPGWAAAYSDTWIVPSLATKSVVGKPINVPQILESAVSASPGKLLATGTASTFPNAEYRVIKNATGEVSFQYRLKGGDGTWKIPQQKGLFELTNMIGIEWVTPGKTNVVEVTPTVSTPSIPEPATPKVGIAHLSSTQKHNFYMTFKDEKVSPSWSGAKIYTSLQAAKLKMSGDSDIAQLTDEQMLEVVDNQLMHLKYYGYPPAGVDTHPFATKVLEWLKTPNGKKAALAVKSGSIPTSSPVKSPALKIATPLKQINLGTAGTAHISANDKEGIYSLFKSQSYGKYLKDSPADIYYSAYHLSQNATFKKKHGDNISAMQVLQIVDEENAKKFGSGAATPPDFSFVHKVEKWLNTPNGQKYGNDVQNDTYVPGSTNSSGAKLPTKKLAKKAKKTSYGSYGGGYSSPSYVHAADKPHSEKITAPTFNVPYDASKPESAFKVISTTSASTMWQKQTAGNEPTSAQISALKSYTGSGYVAMNNYLRGQSGASQDTHNKVNAVQAMMRPSTQDIILHRGNGWFAGWNSYEQALSNVGKTMHQQGFFSTSVGGKEAFSGKSIQFVVEAPAGTPMLWAKKYSHFSTENEMLLAAGLRYKVISVTKPKPGTYGTQAVVRLRVIGEDEPS